MNILVLGVSGFETPARLWWLLLLPLFIALYVFLNGRKKTSGIRFTNTSVLSQVLPKQSQWVRHVTVALSLLSLLTLVGAWAQPLGVDRVPRERATIVVVIDVSQSMASTDVEPNRFDAAKTAAKTFVQSLPEQYNVSLISLSGNPAVRVPPILDRSAVLRAIDTLELQDGTAIGSAIETSLVALDQAPKADDGTSAPGMIVLLSDGANTAGQAPLQAAQQAKDRHIPIYTIPFGTEDGYVDLDGERFRVPPDRALMQQISGETGGQMYPADDLSGLNEAYKQIQSNVGYEEVSKPITATAAGIGLGLALLACVGAVLLGARWV